MDNTKTNYRMKKIIAGNWKMNLNVAESVQLAEDIDISFDKLEPKIKESVNVILAPNYLSLDAVAKTLQKKNSMIAVSAQDVHWQEQGAYTGKIAVSMLSDSQIQYSLVGHSEQRLHFHETDEKVNLKIKQLLKSNLTPIVCVGETLQERKNGIFQEVVLRQLREACKDLPSLEIQKLIIAYEPVWAIGTGEIASKEQIQEVHQFIKTELKNLCLENLCPVLYGGSVKPQNSAEIMQIENVNGVLVGGASLKVKDFVEIIASV